MGAGFTSLVQRFRCGKYMDCCTLDASLFGSKAWIGHGGAGKLTILEGLNEGQITYRRIMFGFVVIDWKWNNIAIHAYALGLRAWGLLLPMFFLQPASNAAHGGILVVDSGDWEKLHSVKEEFHRVLSHEHAKGIPLLIFANKQDLPTALSPFEISHELGLFLLKDNPWFIQGANATTGYGIREGLEWLVQNVM